MLFLLIIVNVQIENLTTLRRRQEPTPNWVMKSVLSFLHELEKVA